MPIIQRTIEATYAFAERVPLVNKILSNSYVNSGVETVVLYGKGVVVSVDSVIDNTIDRVMGVRASAIEKSGEARKQVSAVMSTVMNRYQQEKADVIHKAKEYKSALSGQVSETVKQAPEVVKNLSTRAVCLTKQGLEISIGQEKTETVFNTVKTHTPRFVSSFLDESLKVAESPSEAATTIAAH